MNRCNIFFHTRQWRMFEMGHCIDYIERSPGVKKRKIIGWVLNFWELSDKNYKFFMRFKTILCETRINAYRPPGRITIWFRFR